MKPIEIAIIEDDEIDQRLIIYSLNAQTRYQNLKIEFFSSGEAFIAEVENADFYPSIIICDINLPAMNGFDTIKLLESRYSANKMPLTIILSGAHHLNNLDTIYELHIDRMYQKPDNRKSWCEIMEMVFELWEKKQAFTNLAV